MESSSEIFQCWEWLVNVSTLLGNDHCSSNVYIRFGLLAESLVLRFFIDELLAPILSFELNFQFVLRSGTESRIIMENETLTKKNDSETFATTSDFQESDRYFYIGIYGAIIAGIFVASLLRNFALVFWTMSSSSQLHNNLFMSLVRAPMNFFEKNSMGRLSGSITETFLVYTECVSVMFFSGRVLNRTVNDIGNIDDNLPRIYQAVVNVSSLVQNIFTIF